MSSGSSAGVGERDRGERVCTSRACGSGPRRGVVWRGGRAGAWRGCRPTRHPAELFGVGTVRSSLRECELLVLHCVRGHHSASCAHWMPSRSRSSSCSLRRWWRSQRARSASSPAPELPVVDHPLQFCHPPAVQFGVPDTRPTSPRGWSGSS